jgi:hypothetical protein
MIVNSTVDRRAFLQYYPDLINMPTIVHFDIPADDPEQAKSFYGKLFGWKFERPMEAMEYYLMESEALNEKPDQEEVWGKEELQTRK